jgi:molybdenum cofactor synthesis domain-containing protein
MLFFPGTNLGEHFMAIQTSVLTVGDKYIAGTVHDEAADILESTCRKMGWEMVHRDKLSGDPEALAGILLQLADSGKVDVIFTVDGIGLQATDRVPEAMHHVCEKWIPGLAEMIRNRAFEKSPGVAVTNGMSGLRGKTLIINLPGTPAAVKDAFDILRPVLRHAVDQIKAATA